MTTVTGARSQRTAARTAAARIVRLLNEVEAGLRPPRQICPLFAVHLRGLVRRLQPSPGPVAELRRLAITSTVAGAYEVVAICRRSGRFTATGLQLSQAGREWIVTDFARLPGEVGAPEPPSALSDPTGRRGPQREPRG